MLLDYDVEYKKAYKENVRDVPRAVKAGELDEKINNFCRLHGFSKKRVKKEIKNNKIVAALFAKNPNRQKFHEKVAANFIKNIDGVTSFKYLGNNELGLVEGKVYSKSQLDELEDSTEVKTIDFQWKFGHHQFYASHKHTSASGGSQDLAYRDLRPFISEANQSELPNTFFLAIADGNFYQHLIGKESTSRIDRLRAISNNINVFACTIDELEALMIKLTQ